MVDDVESSPEEVVEVLIGDDIAEKEVAARRLDLQTYRREEAWLTVVLVGDVQNPLCGDSQNRENDLLECLRANEYQSGAGWMAVDSPSFGKLSAVNV